jgi:hypothetical protein
VFCVDATCSRSFSSLRVLQQTDHYSQGRIFVEFTALDFKKYLWSFWKGVLATNDGTSQLPLMFCMVVLSYVATNFTSHICRPLAILRLLQLIQHCERTGKALINLNATLTRLLHRHYAPCIQWLEVIRIGTTTYRRRF